MALPHVLSGKKSSPVKRMLALDIGSEVVTAALWAVTGGHAKVLKISSPIEWQEGRPDELAEAADVAFEELGKEAADVDEVVLGLLEEWLENDRVSSAKKPFLKIMSDQLKLKPVGFVVSHEALVAYLHELEGSPINAVCVEYTTSQLFVFVMKTGVKGETIAVGRSGSSPADLSEALSRLKAENFPARIILFSARMKEEELEKEKQELLAADLQKTFPFLHIPKIETLPHNVLITSVSVAGGSEIAHGEANAGLAAAEMAGEGKNPSPAASAKQAAALDEPLEPPRPPAVHQEHSAEELGFHEVGVESNAESAVQQNEQSTQVNTSAESIEEPNVLPVSAEYGGRKSFHLPKMPSLGLGLLVQKLGRALAGGSLSSKFKSTTSGAATMRLAIVGVVVVAIVGAVGGLIFLSMTAQATALITIKTAPVSQDVTLTLNSSAVQSNPASGELKVEKVTRDVTGELEADTTGTKIVGDKAKGKVTIYNATSNSKTFPAGTVLTGPKGLKFTLDKEITVASSSGSSLLNSQPGNATADVTASNIGTESNVGAKNEFSVANFDKNTYVASNENPFTGGSSREIQAVSKNDMDKLEMSLTQQLQKQAAEELLKEQPQGVRIIPTGAAVVKDKAFDAKAGDEARSLKLTLTMTATALKYTSSDLTQVATAMLQSSLPSGGMLREEKTAIDTEQIEESTGSATLLHARLSSEIIPSVDKQAWTNFILGRSVEQALSILRDQKEVGDVEIEINPSIAGAIFKSIPKDSGRVSVQTKLAQP